MNKYILPLMELYAEMEKENKNGKKNFVPKYKNHTYTQKYSYTMLHSIIVIINKLNNNF